MEIWKNVYGYENSYEVSNLGNIRSVDRYVKNKQGFALVKGNVINGTINKQGYVRVGLSRNNKNQKIMAHRIVAIAFLGLPIKTKDVNHKNGIKNDNRVVNLEWCTRQENILHAIKNEFKTYKTGKEHHHTRLVLNFETGIFYEGAKDAANYSKYSYGHLKNMLAGSSNNKSQFIYV